MKLTKQALARLENAPVLVTLFNGCFNVASVRAEFSRYSVELRVEVTNPALAWQCGNKNEVRLVYWQGYNGTVLKVPASLEPLVEKLREVGAMSNEEAQRLSRENAAAFAKMAEEFGSL